MDIKALILRHLQSEGFKKRWRHIYLPFLKKKFKEIWAYYRTKQEQKEYGELYTGSNFISEDSELEVEEVRATSAGELKLPQYEDIAGELDNHTLASQNQRSTGQCAAFTFGNIYRHILKNTIGAIIDFAEFDLYKDRKTKKEDGHDAGMYPAVVARRMATKGIAPRGSYPDVTNSSELLEADTGEYDEEFIDTLRVKGLIKEKHIRIRPSNYEGLLEAILKIPKGMPFQVSLTSTNGYWGKDMPVDGTKKYGGHSVMGIGGYVFMYRGEKCFRIVDSAHRESRATEFKHPSIRHISETFFKTNGWGIRVFEFPEHVLRHVKDMPTEKIVISITAKHGARGAHVIQIQKALIKLGFYIPDGATGYYGDQTALAVKQFHLKYHEKFTKIDSRWTKENLAALKGRSFGNLSLRVINTLL